MEKFKEKKIVKIAEYTIMIMMLCWFLGMFIGMFYHPFLVSFLILPLTLIPIIISFYFSERNKYTSEFIIYIKGKISKAKTLEELNYIYSEFMYLAVDDKTYCLSYPLDLKNIHRDILSKIEILENQKQ
jgi:hypothetical protein